MAPTTLSEFQALIQEIEQGEGYARPLAFGVGLATEDSSGNLLDSWFPVPNFEANYGTAAVLAKVLSYKNGTRSFRIAPEQLVEIIRHFVPFEGDGKQHANIDTLKSIQNLLHMAEGSRKVAVAAFIAPKEQDSGPAKVPDAYLRLHLLSHRLVKPHGVNLNGIFKVLPNVAWTSEGPVGLQDLNHCRMLAMVAGRSLTVHSVDKFPRMADYVIPSGVRIADASRVRLGAYLGEGTTVMHEGFINFNAGCEGPNMVEGRISAGVFVKKGSDLGGGCSTMGTLSGGGNIVISVGEDCLLGANSGLGIPLGNRCTIEAGLYITAGTKVAFAGKVVKASELAGKDDLVFRRNSQTGQVEAISKANSVELNAALHAN